MSRANRWIGPSYLFLCLLLGGSVQGAWANMILRLLGLAIIACAAAAPREEPLSRPAARLLLIAILGTAIVLLQLVPLPPSLWSGLGPRQRFAHGYALLGLATPALPVSLAPYDSLDALLSLIPGLAAFCSVAVLRGFRPALAVAALLAGAAAGILLGALQVSSGDPRSSPWYLYAETNFGSATGFFANSNHMATLLVVTLPFLAALVIAARRTAKDLHSPAVLVASCGALLVVAGIVLNGSLAGYALALPAGIASVIMLLPRASRWRFALVPLAALSFIGALGAIGTSSIGTGELGAVNAVQSREEILATTARAIRDFMPLGSGLGTFRQVYPLFEDPAKVTSTYAVHAHDDYAEIALETGVPGIACLLLFLAWWGAAALRAFRSDSREPFARAAAIASAAILVHSIVDFPLRTAAIGCCFGIFLGLLARKAAPAPRQSTDGLTERHAVIR